MKKLNDFKPATENANKHNARGLNQLDKSMAEDGYTSPMTAAADGEMIAGSARLEMSAEKFQDVDPIILEHDGTRPIIAVRTDIPNAKTPMAKRISIRDNRIGEIDLEWDAEQIFKDMEAGLDLGELGFDEVELTELFEELDAEPPPEPPEAQIDRAEELQEVWKVEEGDLWEIGEHRLLCGDCRESEDLERLTKGERVNGIFTSPPYAMQRNTQYGGVEVEEYVEWWEAVQAGARSVLAEDGSFFLNIKPHCEKGQRVLYVFDLVLAMVRRWGWRFVDELCWRHPGYPGGWDNRLKNEFEPIYHFCTSATIKFRVDNVKTKSIYGEREAKRFRDARPNDNKFNSTLTNNQTMGDLHYFTEENNLFTRPGNVLDIQVSQEATGQSATFPLKLPTFFIKAFSDPGDLWLDPFCGSGTTILAAHQEGRRGLGIEKLPKYCSVILQRFQDAGLEPHKEIT